MEKAKYLLLSVFLITLLGCEKDNKYSDDDFHPRIFGSAFNSNTRVINEGQSTTFNGLTFSPSPAGKTSITWKVNGEVVSTDTVFTFEPESPDVYEIKLEATFNGQTATRKANVIVNPLTYTFKPYTNVIMPYISSGGIVKYIDWSAITHIAYNGARVIPDGTVDFSAGNVGQLADEIVAKAHINGLPALLGVSGRLSGLDGWSVYNSSDFGNVISDPALRAILVQQLVDYVSVRRFDGIDIMMTDVGNDDATIVDRNMKAITTLIQDLKSVLPAEAIITVTVAANWLHWNYNDLSAANWLNVHAFENGVHVGPGVPLGQPSPLSFMQECANIWKDTKGYPADKLVIGVPAFGLQYNELDTDGNNLGWSSYSYIAYKDIIAADPTAPQNEFTDKIGQGVYYNGVPLVSQKAQYIKDNGFKGAYIWAGDYDTTGSNSLTTILSQILK
ncbi:glycosyl hydrolase family 18 protein [Pseudopedobacter beijingensis]|uniref:chitinase n=1 Tax=Pseudopedobacter beijingensis TaxID=1207056 RepID=A0ABW4IGM7_9SPHI